MFRRKENFKKQDDNFINFVNQNDFKIIDNTLREKNNYEKKDTLEIKRQKESACYIYKTSYYLNILHQYSNSN